MKKILTSLSIIVVAAAITYPHISPNYKYKKIGITLNKFFKATETQTKNYVIKNGSFKNQKDVMQFVNSSYSIKKLDGIQDKTILELIPKTANHAIYYTIPNKNLKAILKDNISINIKMAKENKFIKHRDAVNVYSIGLPVFNIDFSPNVKGLPENIQKNFNFVVTELGYVIPNDNDMCLWKLQNENWLTTAETFNTPVCKK